MTHPFGYQLRPLFLEWLFIAIFDICRRYPRGTLLELNEDGSYKEHTHTRLNQRVQETIRCDSDGDVAPLNEVEECYLLDGVQSAADRYEVYNTPGKLEWGRSLKVGDTVLARLRDGGQQHQYTTAIIRWCGKIIHIVGDPYRYGVEIMVSIIIIPHSTGRRRTMLLMTTEARNYVEQLNEIILSL